MMSEPTSHDLAQAAKAKAVRVFTDLVGAAVAVGIETRGDEKFGLKVNLPAPPPAHVTLPQSIDGVPVRVEVVGTIRKR
ncbi:MAG: hypothetical protein WCL32_20825 [Planctomycetota bacterium]